MKKMTSGKLQAIFAKQDADTILRYTNVRRFAIENNIDHIFARNVIMINPTKFMEAVNPKCYAQHYQMPRIRTERGCVKAWNKQYKRWQIDKHDIERLIREDKISHWKHGGKWVLNYDEAEAALKEYVKTYKGHTRAKKNRHKKR